MPHPTLPIGIFCMFEMYLRQLNFHRKFVLCSFPLFRWPFPAFSLFGIATYGLRPG